MIRAAAAALAQPSEGAATVEPVVQRYRPFFALLEWSPVTERDAQRRWPGRSPHPRVAYVKAVLVKLCEQKASITDLRRFLVEHPALVLELGVRPVLAPTQPFGFDVERTVPCARWLRHHQQQHLDHGMPRALLAATVPALQREIPGLGTTVAVDVKHSSAWVQENNPQASVTERYDAARQPPGDPDGRLGVKRATNQERPTGPPAVRKEDLWGDGTGVASATDPWDRDVVLAEWPQPFNEQDVTCYHPLDRQAVASLGDPPTNVAADAACDAWHVDQTGAQGDGIAAIPLNLRGQAPPDRDPQGRPRCAKGLTMVPRHPFIHEDGYRALRHGSPLLVPTPTGQTCDDAHFRAGTGCSTAINPEPGGLMRATLDRQPDAFTAIYRQRTSAERINRQATAPGIERPTLRNARSVHRLNTLTYLVINARALQRTRALNTSCPRPPAPC